VNSIYYSGSGLFLVFSPVLTTRAVVTNNSYVHQAANDANAVNC